MPFVMPEDLPTPLVPVAWLIGHWQGTGIVEYPTIEKPITFKQDVEFRTDGRPFLSYRSSTMLLDADGNEDRPGATEMGFWRIPQLADPEADAKQAPGIPIEVLLTHPMGYVEIYYGRATGARVDLETDLVGRTNTAKEYTAAKRMYGSVQGDLLWVMDMAAVGQPMASHASARLSRVKE